MKKETFKIHMEFTEPVLGSACGNPSVHAEFIAARAKNDEKAEEETAAVSSAQVAEEIEKAKTVFPRDDDGFAHMWDYQVRGFFKESIAALIELGDCKISKWQYKRAVDSFLFVSPRRVYLLDAKGGKIKETGSIQRPLRAQTMQGERIALANSEMLPVGTKLQFEVMTLMPTDKTAKTKLAIIDETLLKACLDYGSMKGFGQWRSGGYGRYSYKMAAAKA